VQEESSFLKKRSKRLLILALLIDPDQLIKYFGLNIGGGEEIKVFWFFSSEKNAFPPNS
jgi:hypothetical protein